MKAPQAHMAFVARCSSRLNVFSPYRLKVFHLMANDLFAFAFYWSRDGRRASPHAARSRRARPRGAENCEFRSNLDRRSSKISA